MAHPPVGIDFGTSTSEIACFIDGEPKVLLDRAAMKRSPIIPSIVAIDRRLQLLVGDQAATYIDVPGKGIREIKRLMGTDKLVALGEASYRPQEIAALILKHLRRNAEEALGMPISRVVLSVPANFDDAARQATKDAAELSGLEVIRLINEPTAAALAFGIRNITHEGQVVVFDFGGGTLDITVLEMVAGVLDVKASYGDPQLGGKEFDESLVKLILARFERDYPSAEKSLQSMAALRTEAERVKICLTASEAVVARCPNFAVVAGKPVELEYEVTRREFESAVHPLIERARSCVSRALTLKKIRREAVDSIILVGGTTYIPAVRNLVAELFGKEPLSGIDPDLAVAQGAAIQAALAEGQIPSDEGIILTDVCPFGLGVAVAGWVGRHFVTNLYDALIDPNTTIPFSVKRTYSLIHEKQQEVTLTIYQDHEGLASTIEEALATGLSATIKDIPLSTSGAPHPVEVEFSYDINGMVKLHALIPTTGNEVEVVSFNDASRRLALSDRDEARSRVDELWRRSPMARDYEPILMQAEKVLGRLDEDGRKRVAAAIEELKAALAGTDASRIEKAGDELIDVLFDFE
ncbi:MAG: Hsp70 family protein [Candidatus Eremiobacteraeota bacterium]|nr:Hsp70 family protein [Candidatus Eremiobacteraeota bacterium]